MLEKGMPFYLGPATASLTRAALRNIMPPNVLATGRHQSVCRAVTNPKENETMATKSKKTAAKRITAAKAKAIKGAKARVAKAAKAKAAKAVAGAPKAGTKLAQLTEMLSRKEGATTAELCKALGWQPHTLRAAISRLPNKPTHARVDGVTSYRIEA